MMEMLLGLIAVLLVGVMIGVGFLVMRLTRVKKDDGLFDKSFALIQNQINALTQMQNEKLDRTTKELNDRLREQNLTLNEQLNKSNSTIMQQFAVSQKNLMEYTEGLKNMATEVTKMTETGKQIQGFAGQLQSLENILKNPKQRGVLGEYFLENVLKNVMPPGSYQMQYKFSDGEIVDAAVFVKDKIIPIDSKFSLENYNRIVEETDPVERERLEKLFKQDLKNRIEETSKYIRSNEGTMDFAFMFIPSEGIYYDLLVNKVGAIKLNTVDLINYAFAEKKVIIVSPTSFLAYLQTVLQGLRCLQIEESAQQIVTQVKMLQKHLNSFEENFDRVGKHLGTTVNAYNASFKNIKSIDKDVFKITGDAMIINADEVEKPIGLSDL